MRVLFGLLVAVAVAAVAVYLADRPGEVGIVWQGWEIRTSVGVLVAAMVLFGVALAGLIGSVAATLGFPGAWLRRRRERRRRAGYRALTRGMVAVAAGDAREAERFARRADHLLAEPPLTLLLSAQVAQLSGDETAARRFFMAMLDRPETEFLGLRGLFNQAQRAGDGGAALRLAERAKALRPHTPWVVESLFALQARAARWEAARDTLADAIKRRLLPAARARHHQGVIVYELSRAAEQRGDRRQAVALAARAQSLAPDLAAPACRHARLLLALGRPRPAAKAIERAWRTAAHPDLARAYAALDPAEPALARLRRCERLAAQNPGARESRLMLAEAALDARLWGEARRHLEELERADPAGPTRRVCALIARLEEGENAVPARVRAWLDRAVGAAPDPRYICAACGGESLEWQARCRHCGGFDTLAWRTPARSVAAGTAEPEAVEPAPAPLPPAAPAAPSSAPSRHN
jgi:HemY protein